MSETNVGVLVNGNLFKGIPLGHTNHEHISFYEDCSAEYGLVPVFFRLGDISLRDETVRALVKAEGSYRLQTIALPKVIHNRAIFFNDFADRILETLCAKKGIIVFNRRNRYDKWHIHRLLMQHPGLSLHLPETVKATVSSICELSGKHGAVIVKPSNSSLGRGIMMVNRLGKRWLLTYPAAEKERRDWRTVPFKSGLPAVLRQKILSEPYVAQQRVNLATYGGRPFDMRVSVQRGGQGTWQMTGIAVKVAEKNVFVTNVAQGGTVFTLTDALGDHPHLDPAAVRESIERFSLSAAEYLSTRLPFLSDIGFDIGITPEGFPFFIEMNLRDLRYSFQEGGMMEEWKRTYANPIGYAKYLLDGNKPGPSSQLQPALSL